MKKFTLVDATTVAGAVTALGAPKAAVLAGGTDLIVRMKDFVSPTLPDTLVDIKNISGLDYIKEEGGVLKIGATTKLATVYNSTIVQGNYSALAEAAHRVGTPELRNMGTIGGNICQEVWCWYYRGFMNQFYCLRKGGALCLAMAGDNRYHSILGYTLCPSVCPSDTAVALGALNATVVTNLRSIPVLDFFKELKHDLAANEIVTEIQVPTPKAGTKQVFQKFAMRKSFDFALTSVAAAVTIVGGSVTDARIVLGAVAPVPYRATAAEDAIKGKALDDTAAGAAGIAAVKDAKPLSKNLYKVQIAKTLVKRALLAVK
jgi:xanthine dehydrogenase YagS FAD-binding subunit